MDEKMGIGVLCSPVSGAGGVDSFEVRLGALLYGGGILPLGWSLCVYV